MEFADLQARVQGAANQTALDLVRAEIQEKSDVLPAEQLATLFDALSARADVITGSSAGSSFVMLGDGADDDSDDDEPITLVGEWNSMFEHEGYLENLRAAGLAGQLPDSKFRSVAWKLFLDVLPPNRSEWKAKLTASRKQYDDLVKELVTDPHEQANAEEDLSKNNPLAIDDDAPWQKFFNDSEFRKKIDMDVKRTFPEDAFFRSERVQEDMLNILFCYSRKFPDLSYRQGMHELVAGVYKVCHLDALGDTSAVVGEEPTEMMKVVLDPAYIAHDVFALFAEVMEVATAWFMQNTRTSPTASTSKLATMEATPFSDDRDMSANSAILAMLSKIHDKLLKDYDSEVFHRLQVLDISPSIYGLRWIRVLFAREFSFDQTFRLWDAIFADSSSLALVDYIFVAMLCKHRQIPSANSAANLPHAHTLALAVTTKDAVDCMRTLMSPFACAKADEMQEMHDIIEHALHIRDPKNCPKPAVGAPMRGRSSLTSPPPKAAASASRGSFGASAKRSSASSGSGADRRTANSGTAGSKPVAARSAAARSSMNRVSPSKTLPAAASATASASEAAASQVDKALQAKVAALEAQVKQLQGETSNQVSKLASLQGENDTLQAMNKYYGERLSSNIDKLQDELLVTDRLPDDDVIFLALAGMKEVKDILRGYVKPDFPEALATPIATSGPAGAPASA